MRKKKSRKGKLPEKISQLLTSICTLIERLNYYWRYRQWNGDGIEVAINRIFHKYGIKREDYHEGQIKGVCVRHLMDESEDIIHGFFIFLKNCSWGDVTNENVKHVCRTHARNALSDWWCLLMLMASWLILLYDQRGRIFCCCLHEDLAQTWTCNIYLSKLHGNL